MDVLVRVGVPPVIAFGDRGRDQREALRTNRVGGVIRPRPTDRAGC